MADRDRRVVVTSVYRRSIGEAAGRTIATYLTTQLAPIPVWYATVAYSQRAWKSLVWRGFGGTTGANPVFLT